MDVLRGLHSHASVRACGYRTDGKRSTGLWTKVGIIMIVS